MMDLSNSYCIWLTFNSRELENLIVELSNKFDSPIFQPHCTLLGKTSISPIKLKSAILSLTKFDIKMITFSKVGYSQDYWRSYYLEIAEKKIVKKMHETIIDNLDLNVDINFFPHISLMYNSIDERIKKGLQLSIKKELEIPIRSVQIVECGKKVESWKPIFELKF
jgi:hypothetical protein